MSSYQDSNANSLIDFLNNNFRPATPIGPTTELVRSEVLDSYGIVEVIAFIETTFQIQVPDEELTPDNFRSIADICTMLEKLV